ncbi:Aspartate carbamoyltransferase 1, chloroplastic [Sesamum angolense]|uniref:aspartate carbamoyltransferase n=1 Tax=Sesamum angolense TaxID=2727404 RepID=A0AAE2BUS2_9LAMI|nr:Aspartate carbamoyltransferase 1, chloroplastic [Sesamum angolense]
MPLKVVLLTVMASSSTFSAWALNGGLLVPKVSRNNSEFICNDLDCCVKRTPFMPTSPSAHVSRSCVFPGAKAIDWRRGKLSPKSGLQCKALEVDTKHSFSLGNKFQLEDVIEAQQFDRDTLTAIFEVALEMEKIEKNSAGSQILKGYLMATLFYEPSTRTRLSFESAMKRLGGEVLTTENAREFSSAAKGETLEDTIRTVQGYSDIIVMRHFESGAARRAATTASIPIINAGDGPGQHPTQALLDVYTIQREIGKLDGIKVGLVGDLAYGRTVRSLAYLLAKYKDVKIYFVSPEVVKMKDDIKDYLTSRGVEWEESADLLEVASKCDVVYQTRIQRERFGERIDLYEEARGKYIVNLDVLNVMQKHAVVMHPLPRLDEITVDVDVDPRAAYFRQAKNGLYIRMALLKLLLLGVFILDDEANLLRM